MSTYRLALASRTAAKKKPTVIGTARPINNPVGPNPQSGSPVDNSNAAATVEIAAKQEQSRNNPLLGVYTAPKPPTLKYFFYVTQCEHQRKH